MPPPILLAGLCLAIAALAAAAFLALRPRTPDLDDLEPAAPGPVAGPVEHRVEDRVEIPVAAAARADESVELRALRLQVAALTQALEARGEAGSTHRRSGRRPRSERVSRELRRPRAVRRGRTASALVETPGAVVPAPAPLTDAVPEVLSPLEHAPAPVAPLVADHHSESRPDAGTTGYADLSRSLARAGLFREAALAQWAADLRVLAPLLGDRVDHLDAAMSGLAPADAAMAVSGARAVALSMLDTASAGVLLPEISHLTASWTSDTEAGPAGDRSVPELPERELAALEAVLASAATRGGDHEQVSVTLRCELAAHLVTNEPDRARDLLRETLEEHERPQYDALLAANAS